MVLQGHKSSAATAGHSRGASALCVGELGPITPRNFPPAPGWSPDGQGFYAPIAQNAVQEGPIAAANIIATIRKTGLTKTFAYKPIGCLARLGQRQAVAQLGKLRMSGLPAWRRIYLAKLPSLADKVRVGVD